MRRTQSGRGDRSDIDFNTLESPLIVGSEHASCAHHGARDPSRRESNDLSSPSDLTRSGCGKPRRSAVVARRLICSSRSLDEEMSMDLDLDAIH
jgi:hypothetical protein